MNSLKNIDLIDLYYPTDATVTAFLAVPPEQREALLRRLLTGTSEADIARVLGEDRETRRQGAVIKILGALVSLSNFQPELFSLRSALREIRWGAASQQRRASSLPVRDGSRPRRLRDRRCWKQSIEPRAAIHLHSRQKPCPRITPSKAAQSAWRTSCGTAFCSIAPSARSRSNCFLLVTAPSRTSGASAAKSTWSYLAGNRP